MLDISDISDIDDDALGEGECGDQTCGDDEPREESQPSEPEAESAPDVSIGLAMQWRRRMPQTTLQSVRVDHCPLRSVAPGETRTGT